MPHNFIIVFLLSLLTFSTSFTLAEEEKNKNLLPDSAYFDQFQDIYKRVIRDYVEEPDKQKMTDAAIEGMLNSLDPYSIYVTGEDLNEFLDQTKGEFGGIGVEITYTKGAIKVITPIDDLPAYKAGIKPGDYIVGVNGEFVSNLGFYKAIKEMRGPPNTKVKLLILKEDESEPKEIELTREIVVMKPIKGHLEKNNIAYMRIAVFNEHTIAELKKSLKNLQNEAKGNLNGIILDLRNNPGGLLDQAVAVSEYFIDSGVIVTTKGRAKNSNLVFTSNKQAEKAPEVPIVALINGGSASASEIVAGALKDHKRAILLGTKTFGKGTVQSFNQISPKAGVKLTTAKYYTPNGCSIQADGVEPDITVEVAKIEYPEPKNIDKRFSESSLKNHIKNEQIILKTPAKTKDDPDNTKDTKGKNSQDQLSELYKKDYQFSRAYDLIIGLNLIKKSENGYTHNN